MSAHLAGRSLAWWKQALGRALNTSVWERSVFIWTLPSKLDFAAESCGIGELTKFRGFPIMRMITATTAFKMPLYGINFPLSVYSVSSTVFRNTEKLACANEVSASKQQASSKPLLIKACFYPTEVFPVATPTLFLIFRTETFCALKNSINPILQPRSPAMDYRGCFVF